MNRITPTAAPQRIAAQKQKELMPRIFDFSPLPSRRDARDVPPCPKMLPSAIRNVNIGAPSETPATRFVSPVCATKYVSVRLYTREITIPQTTGITM